MIARVAELARAAFARLEDRMRGHAKLGSVTFYGANAMHWGVTVWTTRFGYVCFRLPFPCFGRWWPLYLYASPNATPWAATFFLDRRGVSAQAEQRRAKFGHRFHVQARWDELCRFNDGVPVTDDA